MPRLADAVFEFIENQNIDKVFLLPGGGAMHLVDAVSRRPNINFIGVHHEQAAGIAAEYYSRIKSNVGVALVTTGPGATNVITPFVGAWIESIPILVISGQVKSKDLMRKEDNIRQSGVQEVDIIPMVKNCSKFAITLKDPLKIRFVLEKAFYLMNKGRKGPAWIDIPLDIQGFTIPEWDKLESFIKPTENPKNNNKILDDLYKSITNSERPLLLVGHGVRLAGAHNEIKKLIEKFKLPSVFTWNACDMLDYRNKYYVGKPGNVATRAANFAIQTCTDFISIGARLDNITTAYDIKSFARNASQKWVLDIDENQLKICDLKDARKIAVDLKYAIKYLNTKRDLKEKSEWINHCIWLKEKYSTCDGKIPLDRVKLTHFEAAKIISDAIPENSTIITGSSGLAIEAFYVAYEPKKLQRILLTSGLGAMGYGLPAFVGAIEGLSDDNKKFLIESDGSLMLNLQELQTLKTRNKKNLKIIILNNEGYCSIRATQKNYFGGNYVASNKESGIEIPNLSKISKSFGIKYYLLDNSNKNNFKEIIQDEETALIEIKLVEEEALWPKVSVITKKDGSMVSMPLEDMSPLLSEKELNIALGFNNPLSKESIKARKN